MKQYSAFTLYLSAVGLTAPKILMQHRSADAPRYPSQWGFFGGGVYPGEMFLHAADREAYEELRISLFRPKYLGVFDVDQESQTALYVIPFSQCAGLADLKQRQQEGDDLGLFTLDELAAREDVVESDRVLLRAIGDWFESSSEGWSDDFVRFMVDTPSQYDSTCRALATEVMEHRRSNHGRSNRAG